MTEEATLPLRIIVRRPPQGVRFAVQRGPTAKADLIPPLHSSPDSIVFEFTVRLGDTQLGAPLRFLGPFVHGTVDARFVYVNSGQSAGDHASGWTRRAKVWLSGITTEQVEAVHAQEGSVLEAEVEGTSADGGPVCASTHVLPGGWRIAKRSGA